MVYIRRGASCKKASPSEWNKLNNVQNEYLGEEAMYRSFIE